MAEFQFPRLRVIAEHEEGDKTIGELVGGEAACDFCFDTRVKWDIPIRPFTVDSIGFASDDDWAACSPCAMLIEIKAWGDLEERIYQSWFAQGVRSPTMRTEIQVLLLYIVENLNGPKRPLIPHKK